MKAARMHGLISRSFLSFLVAFHYFSWYIFSLQRIKAAASIATVRAVAKLHALLEWLRKGRGFLIAVISLNLISPQVQSTAGRCRA